MFKKIKKIIIACFVFAALITSANAAELSDWAVDDFINANKAQLIPFSVGARSMCGYITREQFCELIVNTYEKLSGEEIPKQPMNPFTDCDNPNVVKAYSMGLVGGTSDDTFSPDNLVTREEMAKMIHNMLVASELNVKLGIGNELVFSDYSDILDVSSWAKPAMATVINYSLMNGVEGKLMPGANATREQAIAAVSRTYYTFGKNTKSNQETIFVATPYEQAHLNEGDVYVMWNSISNAVAYRVLIRNANGELVVNDEVTSTGHWIVKSMFETGGYNVSVEAVLDNGKEIFSEPTGFYYTENEVVEPMPVVPQVQAPTPVAAPVQQPIAPAPAVSESASSPMVESIFAEGEKYIGTPYVYGGTTPAGFDCSGFVQYVFKNNGIKLKRTSRDQFASNGYSVAKEDLKRGDLVFFGTNGVVGHVGIYAGNGQMLHSPSTGKTVTYTSIESNYYVTHYMGAKRIIG